MSLKKVLIIPDCHIPFEDKRAWALMMKVARSLRPDVVVTLGDIVDFYSVSSHSKDPTRVRLLDVEVNAMNKKLDELDALGASKKIFLEGNHENRLQRYLQDKAPELFNTVKVKNLFNLDRRGWEHVPYKEHTRLGKLYLTHDTGTAGMYAHYRSLSDFQSNVVIGHTHRIGYTVVGSAGGATHVSAMFGWLGDVNQVDYMHKIKAKRDWALGFGVGYMQPNGTIHLTPVPIVNYKVVVEGRLYSV